MVVDSKLVMQAKEKLGVENAEWMSTLLGLRNYDPTHLKALCPYHQEDTPSFVYDKRTFRFHCFGCQRTVDVCDVLIEKGRTYLEATEELFKRAGMSVPMGEKGVKTKTQYRYPKPCTNTNNSKIVEYFGKRKISEKTLRYADVKEDNNGNAVFNFYDTNDVLTLVKYRPARKVPKGECKTWCQKDADTTPLLFNMNRVNNTQPLLITEGEIDCLSAIQSGYLNAVSVPLGAGNFGWIEECWDWLEQFGSIIICADNDTAGQKMVKECVTRLGTWRTKTVQLPDYCEVNGRQKKIKDLNEVLYFLGEEKVFELITNAKDTPINSIVDFSDVEDIDYSTLDGIYTGLINLDRAISKLQYGTFNILTGINGSGKSSFLSQLTCEAVDNDIPVWFYSKELPNNMSKNWLDYVFASPRHVEKRVSFNGSAYYKVPLDVQHSINDRYRGKILMYRDDFTNKVSDITTSMQESVRKLGCKLFIIDNLTTIDFECTEQEVWQKQVELTTFCINFARVFNVVVILVMHPKKIDCMRRLSKFDIQGLSAMVNLAHRVFSLYRVQPKDREKNNPMYECDVILDVLKDRLTGKEGWSQKIYYDIPSRRFFTNSEEYNRQYSWDNGDYEPLPYPYPNGYYNKQQEQDEREVFGA